ncbi:MAG: hypothetical protein LBI26_02650 [Holosporales bacterium]|jgi:hypothetical protein|nr:hypothetical protein [Holosporales bacterium]
MFKRVFGFVVVGVITFSEVLAGEDILKKLPLISYEKSGDSTPLISFLYTPKTVFESPIGNIPDETSFTAIRQNFGNETLTKLSKTYCRLEEDMRYEIGVVYSRLLQDPNVVSARIALVSFISGTLYVFLNK